MISYRTPIRVVSLIVKQVRAALHYTSNKTTLARGTVRSVPTSSSSAKSSLKRDLVIANLKMSEDIPVNHTATRGELLGDDAEAGDAL